MGFETMHLPRSPGGEILATRRGMELPGSSASKRSGPRRQMAGPERSSRTWWPPDGRGAGATRRARGSPGLGVIPTEVANVGQLRGRRMQLRHEIRAVHARPGRSCDGSRGWPRSPEAIPMTQLHTGHRTGRCAETVCRSGEALDSRILGRRAGRQPRVRGSQLRRRVPNADGPDADDAGRPTRSSTRTCSRPLAPPQAQGRRSRRGRTLPGGGRLTRAVTHPVGRSSFWGERSGVSRHGLPKPSIQTPPSSVERSVRPSPRARDRTPTRPCQ